MNGSRATASAACVDPRGSPAGRVIGSSGESTHCFLSRGGLHRGGLSGGFLGEHRGDPLDGFLMRSLQTPRKQSSVDVVGRVSEGLEIACAVEELVFEGEVAEQRGQLAVEPVRLGTWPER